MKKLVAFVLVLGCVLALAGCRKTISGSEVYSFPEPTMQITGTFYSSGLETTFQMGSDDYDPDDASTLPVQQWFYDLELTACDKPEAVAGSENYVFEVKGERAFIYEYRGNDEAYLVVSDNWYKVNNPSDPPIDILDGGTTE